ncbi:hypothetical protein DPMN_153133 [Dreissena polymorpha]|uniref:Uncharacterized protein n=1 Tax=Dreissena polymorpha TaxID=45954 RepID=A0A9D4FIK9_DREPO|nr:hypothetical protein DPMN_153133 [Dreissena polymorpha]
MARETGRWKLTLVEGLFLSKRGSEDPTTRYCTVVRDRKEARHHRADSTMGGKMRIGVRVEEGKVHRTHGYVQATRLAYLAIFRGSWR